MPRRSEDDFANEIESHIQLEADRIAAEQGLDPQAALDAARRAFGDRGQTAERHYEAQRWIGLDRFLQDIRYGLRGIRRSPGFAVVVALTVALGAGANTAIFSLMDAVLFRMLPVQEPGRLVFLSTYGTKGDSGF